jgi:hypothetical protein
MSVGFCCGGVDANVAGELPPPMPADFMERIRVQPARNANFPRALNWKLRPVLQHARVRYPRGAGSSLFISGVRYAVDGFGQFCTTVYAVFCAWENLGAPDSNEMRELVEAFLRRNDTLQQYVADSVDRGREGARVHIPEGDDGFNLALLTSGQAPLMPHEIEAFRDRYGWTKPSQWKCDMTNSCTP